MQINTMVKDSTPITREYFSLWFDHGRNPSDAAYAYILLPNRSAAQTAAYSAAPDAEILAGIASYQPSGMRQNLLQAGKYQLLAAVRKPGRGCKRRCPGFGHHA